MDKWHDKLNNILLEISYAEKIERDMTIRDDLGIDSLRLVELIIKIEEQFGIEMSMSDLDPSNINTVDDLYDILAKYLPKCDSDSQERNSRLYQYLKTSMDKFPQKTLSTQEESITYADLIKFAEQFSKRLTEQKYGILCTSELNSAKAVFSCIMIGATVVPLSYQYGKEHIDHVIEAAQLSFLITDDDAELNIKQIAKRKPESEDLTDVAFILCTSGTTGLPKGAMLTQSNVIANLTGIGNYFEIDDKDRILIIRPLYHCAVMMGEFLISLCKGLDIVFYNSSFNPVGVYNFAQQKQITIMCGTPTLFYHICLTCKHSGTKMPLRVIAVSGECMTETAAKMISERMPDTMIYNVYGLTEAGPRVSFLPPEFFSEDPCSVGFPISSTTVKIEKGELLVKGDSVMKGYYADHINTQNVLRDGWLHTGDLAEIAVDDRITIKGRKDDLIIRGGMNIYPCEIENALRADNRILDVMAFGKTIGVTQMICLQVVTKELTASEIMSICRKTLPAYQIPNELEIVDFIPRSSSGKIKRPKNG